MKTTIPKSFLAKSVAALKLILFTFPVIAGYPGNGVGKVPAIPGHFSPLPAHVIFNSEPVATDDSAKTYCNVTITSFNFALNDYDPDGDGLTIDGYVLDLSGPRILVQSLTTLNGGSVILYANGDFDYSPPLNFIGLDQVNYTICDDNPSPLCSTATIYINVIPGIFLPVNLSRFSGKKMGKDNLLQWTTVQESHLRYFELEQGSANSNFTKISSIGARGSSVSSYTYSFAHQNPSVGANYYRLRMVNDDGKWAYSPVIVIKTDGTNMAQQSVFPNPFRTHLELAFISSITELLNYRITDLNGILFICGTSRAVKGLNTISINGLEKLPAGNYFIDLSGRESIMKQKIIKVE